MRSSLLITSVYPTLYLTSVTTQEAIRKQRIKKISILKRKGKSDMSELLSMFIGKTCSITTIDGNYVFEKFIIKQVVNNGVLCEMKSGKMIAINSDYIVGIQEEKPWK